MFGIDVKVPRVVPWTPTRNLHPTHLTNTSITLDHHYTKNYKQTTNTYYAKLDTAILEIKYNNSEKKFITTNRNPPVEFIYTTNLSNEESLTLVQSGQILGKYNRLK